MGCGAGKTPQLQIKREYNTVNYKFTVNINKFKEKFLFKKQKIQLLKILM